MPQILMKSIKQNLINSCIEKLPSLDLSLNEPNSNYKIKITFAILQTVLEMYRLDTQQDQMAADPVKDRPWNRQDSPRQNPRLLKISTDKKKIIDDIQKEVEEERKRKVRAQKEFDDLNRIVRKSFFEEQIAISSLERQMKKHVQINEMNELQIQELEKALVQQRNRKKMLKDKIIQLDKVIQKKKEIIQFKQKQLQEKSKTIEELHKDLNKQQINQQKNQQELKNKIKQLKDTLQRQRSQRQYAERLKELKIKETEQKTNQQIVTLRDALTRLTKATQEAERLKELKIKETEQKTNQQIVTLRDALARLTKATQEAERLKELKIKETEQKTNEYIVTLRDALARSTKATQEAERFAEEKLKIICSALYSI